jgi:hypothetical protein
MKKLQKRFCWIKDKFKSFYFNFSFNLFSLIDIYFTSDWYSEPIEIYIRFFNTYRYGFSLNCHNGWGLYIYFGDFENENATKIIQITKKQYDYEEWLESMRKDKVVE